MVALVALLAFGPASAGPPWLALEDPVPVISTRASLVLAQASTSEAGGQDTAGTPDEEREQEEPSAAEQEPLNEAVSTEEGAEQTAKTSDGDADGETVTATEEAGDASQGDETTSVTASEEAETGDGHASANSEAVEEIEASQVDEASSVGSMPASSEGLGVEADEPTPAADEDWVLQKTREVVSTDAERRWSVSGVAEYRSKVIVDDDPANDMSLLWQVRGNLELMPSLRAFLQVGVYEAFTAEVDDSGWRLQDTSLGAEYAHELDLSRTGWQPLEGRKLDLEHRLAVFLPTSRASYNRDMYFAPMYLGRARFSVLPQLIAGLDGWFRYRFHRYAYAPGPGATPNTRFDTGFTLGAEYIAFEHERYGSVSVGADLTSAWYRQYAAADRFEAASSSTAFGSQELGWDAYVSYTPFSYLTAVLSFEENNPVLRDGIANVNPLQDPFHRDRTEVALTLIGRY